MSSDTYVVSENETSDLGWVSFRRLSEHEYQVGTQVYGRVGDMETPDTPDLVVAQSPSRPLTWAQQFRIGQLRADLDLCLNPAYIDMHNGRANNGGVYSMTFKQCFAILVTLNTLKARDEGLDSQLTNNINRAIRHWLTKI